MYTDELQVAKKAEQMLGAALRQKTQSFKEHVNRKPDDISLKNASAKAKVKQYGRVNSGTKKRYMRSLSIAMPKHGFVQNFGIDNTRNGGSRTREIPKKTTYGFKSHVMRMKPQPFINQAIESSGVIDFVMENITKLRGEELLFEVKKLIENK